MPTVTTLKLLSLRLTVHTTQPLQKWRKSVCGIHLIRQKQAFRKWKQFVPYFHFRKAYLKNQNKVTWVPKFVLLLSHSCSTHE